MFRATGELHWFLTKATRLVDAGGAELAVNVIEDVTEEQEAALRDALPRRGRAACSAPRSTYEETLQRVAQLVVPRMADWCAIELADEKGRLQQVALAHVDPALRRGRARDARALAAGAGRAELALRGDAHRRAAARREIPDELLEAAIEDPEQLAAVRALGLQLGDDRADDRRAGARSA